MIDLVYWFLELWLGSFVRFVVIDAVVLGSVFLAMNPSTTNAIFDRIKKM